MHQALFAIDGIENAFCFSPLSRFFTAQPLNASAKNAPATMFLTELPASVQAYILPASA